MTDCPPLIHLHGIKREMVMRDIHCVHTQYIATELHGR